MGRDVPGRQLRPGEKGGSADGKTRRGKGTKWMVRVDGGGLPLGVRLDSASPAEVTLAEATLAEVKVPRPKGRPRQKPKRVIAHRAYDSDPLHFTVDGTLIQAWASHKSFRKKDGSDDDGTNCHGTRRSNDTHESTTDPEARLYKKSYGTESKLAYLGHALVENRNGLIAAAMATQADGLAERDAALLMLAEKQEGRSRRITVGADNAYDSQDFVTAARDLNVTPHIMKNHNGRRSNMDARTTRHPCYAISLSCRWLVEKSFGWLKGTGPLRQVKVRGLAKVDWVFVFSCAAHNLLRLPRLIAQPAAQDLQQQCA